MKRRVYFLGLALLFLFASLASAYSFDITDSELDTVRLFGGNRYETAAAISQKGWRTAPAVVLARGDDYADALAGVPLAHALGAPLLLTKRDQLSPQCFNEIQRLGAQDIYILGGSGAVADNIETQLRGLGFNVNRIVGRDRFATAAAVATKLKEIQGAPKKAILVYGLNFPDALAAAPYGAVNGYPILLTKTDSLPDSTALALADLAVQEVLVVGGAGVISEALMPGLPNPRRLAGANRYDTSVVLAEHFLPSRERIYFATGKTFADAITGAVLAAETNNALLLVDQNKIPARVRQYIAGFPADELVVFGGEAAIGASVLSAAKTLAPSHARGNSNGNIVNDGTIASANGWLYFADWTNTNGGIYRMRFDGSQKVKLTDDLAIALNIQNDWLYFFNSGDCSLYRVPITGGDHELMLNKLNRFIIAQNRLIVVDENMIFTLDDAGDVSEILFDGGENWTDIDSLCYEDNYIYFTAYHEDLSYQAVFRINTLTGAEETLTESFTLVNFVVYGNWLYCHMGGAEGWGIYRSPADGSCFEALHIGNLSSGLNILDGWIYFGEYDFIAENECLSRIRASGGSYQQLYSLPQNHYVEGVSFVNGLVFLESYDWVRGDYYLTQMQPDGGNPQQITGN